MEAVFRFNGPVVPAFKIDIQADGFTVIVPAGFTITVNPVAGSGVQIHPTLGGGFNVNGASPVAEDVKPPVPRKF
ncbi:unnamed protein product [Arabidopsis halleri]